MRISTKLPILILGVLFAAPMFTASASAATAGPGFTIDSVATPTNFFSSAPETAECVTGLNEHAESPPCDAYEVSAMNAGSQPTNGSPVTLTDTLPPEATVSKVKLYLQENGNTNREGRIGGSIESEPEEDCTAVPVRCTFPGVVAPNDWLKMVVYVTVNEGAASPLTNLATVSGGGAPSVSTESKNDVGSAPAPFGLAGFGFYKDALNGSQDSQAGAHPYELTTTIDLNSVLREDIGQGAGKQAGQPASVEPVKDIVVDLPLGFAGSTLAAPQCTEAQLDSNAHCPPDTVVGHLTTEPLTGPEGGATINGPIWNIVPEHGHPAEFGYIDGLKGAHIAGYVSVVPTPAGYVLRFVASDIPEININRIVVTFYGDPAAEQAETRQHQTELEVGHPVAREEPAVHVPFFTNPTDCSGAPQVARLWIDSWHNPARFQPGGLIPSNLEESQWAKRESVSPAVTGCDALQFTPELGVQPTTHEADKPSGLEFETKLAQNETFGTNATPALKDLTVTFPEGMTVDPSSANGLGTCSEAQIGWQGPTLFDFSQAPPECPESSKIGSLELESPLLPGVQHGEVFLAAQNENPFRSTFAIYVVVNDSTTGVVLKIAGELKADPATGRLTSVFDENPQLPFSALRVHFFGGPRAELATPPACGTYTTTSELEPWSAPDSGPIGNPFSSYVIDENCAIGFTPSFAALSTNVQAGAFTTFQASFSREDDDQELGGLTMSLPPGLLASVGTVPQCGEAEVKAEESDAPTGGCPASTQVGTVVAEAGPGPNPLSVPGKVFLTGPYNGGPYGLAVVVSANPGPFHFGNVVVRQSLRIDPITAAVTDVSNSFPTFLDPVGANGQTNGIPIKLRRVDVSINRPGFTFNPTNCSKLAVAATITSTQSAVSNHSVPFQVTNCATLKFTPQFSVSTKAQTSRQLGASLTTTVSEPAGAMGTQANITKVKVELPKQLPSRLTTLQKACLAAVFEANPESCGPDSRVGHAVVYTPILNVPLEGTAYLVSHGGEAFPALTMVLKGAGITIDLVGTTFISPQSITSTTFKTVPDTPFTSFQLTLPEGQYSALGAYIPQAAAKGSLCTQKLIMPTEFIAQNGAELHQNTRIEPEGCSSKVAVLSHSVSGKKAALYVYAPAAGKVTVSGKGIGTVSKSFSGREAQSFTVSEKAGGRRHPKVTVTFTPAHGKHQSLAVTARFKR